MQIEISACSRPQSPGLSPSCRCDCARSKGCRSLGTESMSARRRSETTCTYTLRRLQCFRSIPGFLKVAGTTVARCSQGDHPWRAQCKATTQSSKAAKRSATPVGSNNAKVPQEQQYVVAVIRNLYKYIYIYIHIP